MFRIPAPKVRSCIKTSTSQTLVSHRPELRPPEMVDFFAEYLPQSGHWVDSSFRHNWGAARDWT